MREFIANTRWLLLALVFLLSTAIARAENQQALDKILMESGSLEAFLRNPEQRDKYYDGLRQWLGFDEKAFSRQHFNSALKEIEKLNREIPGLGARLMETTGLGTPFKVTSEETYDGRHLAADGWSKRRESWLKDLQAKASSVTSLDEVKEIYRPIEEVVTHAETLSKTARGKTLSSYFEKLRTDPERLRKLEAANAFLILQRLQQGDLRARLDSTDPAVVFAALRDIGRSGPPFPLGSQSLLAELIPKQAALASDPSIFPGENKKPSQKATTYEFVPLMRRFHGLWKGLRAGECVGGGLVDWVDHTTARRLLTVALSGTEHYLIESNGRHLGWTEHVPTKRKSDGAVYASTEYGSEVFGRRVTMVRNGQLTTVPFAEAWWAEYKKVIPKEWKGITKSQAFASHNNGVLPAILEAPSWRFSEGLGQRTDFEYLDSYLAYKIPSHTEVTDAVAKMGTGMLFDASLAGSGWIVAVNDFDPERLQHLDHYEKVWKSAQGNARPWYIAQWLQLAPDRPDIRSFVKEALHSLSKEEKSLLDGYVQKDIKTGIFKASPLLWLRYWPYDLIELFKYDSTANPEKKAFSRSVAEVIPYLESQGVFQNDIRKLIIATRDTALADEFFLRRPSHKQFIKYLRAINLVDGVIAVRKRRVELHRSGRLPFANANEMMRLLSPEIPERVTAYKNALADFHVEMAEDFFRLRPSTSDLRKYLNNTDWAMQRIEIRRKRLQLHEKDPNFRIASASEFIEFLTLEISPSEDYKTKHGAFMKETTPAFLGTRPKGSEFQKFLTMQTTVDAVIEPRRQRLQMHLDGSWPFRDASDFLAYMQPEIKTRSEAYKKDLSAFLDEAAEVFFRLRPTNAQVKSYLQMADYVDGRIGIRKKRIALHESDPAYRFQSAREYLELMGKESDISEGYAKELAALHEKTFELFRGLHPNRKDWSEFLNGSPSLISTRLDFRRQHLKAPGRGVNGALTAADYLDTLVVESSYSAEYRTSLLQYARDIMTAFRETKPTAEDWARVTSFARSLQDEALAQWTEERRAEVKVVAPPASKRCWLSRLLGRR